MRRIFPYLLTGFLLKLFLFENSIVLYASENIRSIEEWFKSANYLVDNTSVPMVIQQNGTERYPKITFGNFNNTENLYSKYIGPEWIN